MDDIFIIGIITLRAYLKSFIQLTKKIAALTLLSTICLSTYQVHASKQSDWAISQKTKIIKYLLDAVIWPKEAIKNNSINVCMLGDFESSKPLMALNGTVINGLKVSVSIKTLKKAQAGCQMVYVSLSEKENVQKIVNAFKEKPVLLISDIGNFADQGGSMNFIEASGIVALTVNVETIKKSNLTFDMNAYRHITVIPKQSDLND